MSLVADALSPLLRPRSLPPNAGAAPRWLTRYAKSLVLLDGLLLASAILIAVWTRFGVRPGDVRGVNYFAVAASIALLWWLVLAFSRCYELRFLGSGTEEFRRVANGSARLAALVAVTCYAFKLDLARGFVAVALPLGTVLLLFGRYAARKVLHDQRRRGRFSHRVVVVGSAGAVTDLVRQLRRGPDAGFIVVGACIPGGTASEPGILDLPDGEPVPVVGTLLTVVDALLAVQADTVAVAASAGLTAEALRRLSYELEGSGVDLLVAPALVNVSGTRVSIRPVAGLPLLHLEEPELSGVRKLVKAAFDRTCALLGLLLLAPLLAVIALLVRLSSRGPVLFRQVRVGRRGELFRVWKFRSMYRDAEERLPDLAVFNEHDGVLFKMRDDPRVTPVGRWLRKYSLDELPQLVNVLRGHMSLVGPRPPLPTEVERYEGHAHRRLLVKPGITGLWQISGRSELSWDESIRLDLHYVENWTLALDLAVLARTVLAVARGRGAY
jgi:exopolysaccharide biosynthesis polyprenyl glycosylphosphotransferase